MTVDEREITDLLAALRDGDGSVFDRIFDLVYAELRRRAHAQLARLRPGDTLSTTALVHETYLKLTDASHQTYRDRIHFFAVASRAMRQILVDYARRVTAEKRGGGAAVLMDLEQVADPGRPEQLVWLDQALNDLTRLDPRLARTVELRFFGGLSVEDTAEALGVAPRTVKRDWQKARALLYEAVRGGSGSAEV